MRFTHNIEPLTIPLDNLATPRNPLLPARFYLYSRFPVVSPHSVWMEEALTEAMRLGKIHLSYWSVIMLSLCPQCRIMGILPTLIIDLRRNATMVICL